jgi:hypothetical protein
MKSVKRKDGWWITGIEDCEDCGPYDTKVEAEETRRGLERFEKWGHLKSFWTGDK